MNGSVLKNGIRTATAATSAAIPYLGKAAIAAVSAGETANAPPEKKSWFTRKNTTPPKESASPTPADPASPTPADPASPTNPTPASPASPASPDTIVPETPEEENLLKKFLQKVRKGDLTDVVNSINDVKPESDDLTVFDQIKKKIKDGDFSDIVKSLPAPPPFPTAVVMQILMSLNEMFQQNIGKISKAVGDTIDIEIEKKKNELALTKALGEQATKTELEPHMKAYIEHELTK